MSSHSATGYVNDVPYVFHFTRELAPAWLDFVVTLSGFEAPSRTSGFAWCELGCGQGVTAAIMAGTHPTGEFHGIDAYAPHIEYARRLGENAGIANLTVHAVDFASAIDIDLPSFDYIVAHGVYSWIDSRSRDDLRRFIDRRLKPGGVVFVSYNAMPGWASDAPFQYLVREVAATCPGDSTEQFSAAMKVIDALNAAGAPPLRASVTLNVALEHLRKTVPNNYFAHEFLPPAWQPLYVTQVRADMASIGLVPAGSGTIRENFDSFVLRPAARDAVAAIQDRDLRELARDFFLDQRFRRDVFIRDAGARRLPDDERSRRIDETMFGLARPAELVECSMVTNVGRLDFENQHARAIIAATAQGPKRIVDMSSDGSSAAAVRASALALAAADEIRPVGPNSVDTGELNRALLLDHGDTADGVRFVALPVGTVVSVPSQVCAAMRDGKTASDELRAWSEFLNGYGA